MEQMSITEQNNNIPEPRGLDNVYVVVERGGKECERCFTDLSADEQNSYLESLDAEGLKDVCLRLAKTARSLAELFRFSCFYEENEE